jgi:hypothetical protein
LFLVWGIPFCNPSWNNFPSHPMEKLAKVTIFSFFLCRNGWMSYNISLGYTESQTWENFSGIISQGCLFAQANDVIVYLCHDSSALGSCLKLQESLYFS